ncbi:hypothetical protein FKW77_005240 [Venturia effusa]|uniref:Uncharacterized protein n=1 Tax=Venturia effusa TaxID=50376 RepID=A0A517LQ50_9PEZI|nr:hypothetical protein FKW77_005240 [Venturia effusa]
MTAISTSSFIAQYEMREYDPKTGRNDQNKSTTVLTRELDDEKHHDATGLIHWKTGVLARFPWLGFAAILTILVSIAMSVVIMKTSDGKTQDQWPAYPQSEWIKDEWRTKAQLKPTVGLAIANSISNLALTIAIGQGVTIAWWRKALNGATVSELHNSWSFSTSTLELMTAGRAFNLIALAALTAKIAMVDNTLLQQAAGAEPDIGMIPSAPVRVPIVDTIPNDYGGRFSSDGVVGTTSQNISQALYGYTSFGDFITPDLLAGTIENQCKGHCYLMAPGFGFNISCRPIEYDTKNYSVTPQMAMNTTSAWTNNTSMNPDEALYELLRVSVFADIVGQDNRTAKYSSILLTAAWADLKPATGPADNDEAETCHGRLLSQTCELRPAKVMYPLQIDNSAASADPMAKLSGYTITVPWWPIDGSWDNTRPIPEDSASPQTTDYYGKLVNGQVKGVQVTETLEYDSAFDNNLQAFASMMNSMFAGTTLLQYLNGTGYIPSDVGASAPMIGTWWTQLTSAYWEHPLSCVMRLINPSTYIMSQVNSIALRVSIELAIQALVDLGKEKRQLLYKAKTSSVSFMKDLEAYTLYLTTFYVSHWAFLWAAIASLLTCVCLLLPSYWGFWQLGRKVTLSPMEIASPFQAPVLSNDAVASGGDVAVLLEETGKRE